MKRLKNILSLLLLGVAVSMTMTSCLNDDNGSQSLTEEQKQSYAMMMAGNYNGKIYYFDKNIDKEKNKSQIDSITGINVRFSYPERSFVIYDFPAKLLFKQLSGHEDMKAAAEEQEVDIKVKYEPYAYENKIIYYYLSEIQPVSLSLNYGEATHDLKVYFLINTYGAWKDNIVNINIYEYGISESTDSNGNPVWLDGKTIYPTDNDETKLKDAYFFFSNETK